MFRRKEESLFDNEFSEEADSFTVVEPSETTEKSSGSANISSASSPASSSFNSSPAASANASVASQSPSSSSGATVAAPAASAQPITRPGNAPAAPISAAAGIRPIPAPSAPIPSPIPRSTEVKSMNPISNPSAPSASSSASQSSSHSPKGRVLTVGNDILLKGEIATCDRLVIEGKVEATLNDVHTVDLAECGSFKGSANVVEAFISGLFEGDLVVTGRLVINSSGKVRGNVTYGEVEIERGGELSGQIKTASDSASGSLPKALRKEAA